MSASDGFDFDSMDLGPSVRARRRGPDGLTRILAGALGLALAFSVGVRVGRASRPPAPAAVASAGASAATGPAAPEPGASPTGPAAQEPGVAVTGRLDLVDRDVLYVTDAEGRRVKIIVGEQAKLSTMSASSRADLQVGDTLVVRGERAPDGTVSAASVISDRLE